jgi:uncharacterized membrane protein
MSKWRMEVFSDGVFAIAITLLVLEIRVPELTAPTAAALAMKLVAQWPAYLAYVTSFLLIGIIWVNHHALSTRTMRVDRPIVIVNLFVLMAVSFLPFPTAVIARYPQLPPSILLYGVTLTILVVFANVLWQLVLRGDHLDRNAATPRAVRQTSLRLALGIVAYAIATPVGFFVPKLGIALFLLIVIFYYVPGGLDMDLEKAPKHPEDVTN